MKKILLLMMCCPAMLAAQNGNGVTVSNLNVEPGTVTFNVSWEANDMPQNIVWSDTVWVFVDYNKAGKMERLPISSATVSAGTVEIISGNSKGVRVIGNARIEGSFSSTVQLLTATDNLSGVCAYASNYPPVGEYIDATHISFTGTPMYKIVLEETAGEGILIDYSDGSYLIREGYTIKSFTDTTGAPGMMKCMLPASYTLQASASSFCAGSEGVQFALSGTEDGRRYQLFRDNEAVDNAALEGDGSAATFIPSFNEAGTYTARTIADEKYCAITMSGTHTIAAYPAFTVGEITTASTITPAGTNPNVTVESLSPALGGSGNTTYLWLRTGTSATTLTDNSATTYMISSGDYSAAGTHYFNRYAKDATCNTAWVAAAGTYTLMVELTGVNQQQGGCTFTQPPPVGTFANFDPGNVGASTFVTLTDGRDGNNYTVVKIGGRWIMAQNLNYQVGLTFNTDANKANGNTFTSAGSGTFAIGSFWCPGVAGATTSSRMSCDVWGAMYTWETAMSYDGKGVWTESPATYYTTGAANSSAALANHGRTDSGSGRGGRGICPPNWHVPTVFEWAVVLDGLESNGGISHQTCSFNTYAGSDASLRGRSKCSGTPTESSSLWSTGAGNDALGFRVLPIGSRLSNGSSFSYIGTIANFWHSGAYSTSEHFPIRFNAGEDRNRTGCDGNVCKRSYGYPVRCIKDQ
jgi:uncharacterized protein (TIGR02145 family)